MAQTAQININVNSKDAQGNVDKLTQSINNAGTTSASLKAQLRQITVELANLQPGSARFEELSKKAGQLRDTIQDTNAVIAATTGNVTENFGRALSNVAQIGVAGFQSVMAAQTLFGIENEDLQKTLAQFGALLNLTQAIETFGGLSDKLVEIKAGFTPLLTKLGLLNAEQTTLATSTAAADAALVGEAVAADGAAVSTGLFGAALNALPLIGIITAVGLLVSGLISYASSTSEAAEKEKQAEKQRELLEKRTKALAKAQDEDRQKVAESSVEYFTLIQRLKETNVGSKQRSDLIKEINSTYGTTLKNIKDEKTFQDQLNLSIQEYIALQVLKVRQQNKSKLEEKAIANLIKAQDELNKFTREYAGMTDKQKSNYDLRTYGVEVYADSLIKLNIQLEDAQKNAEKYAISSGKIQDEIDKLTLNGKQYVEQKKEETKTVKGNTDANEKYAASLEEIKARIARQADAEKKLEKVQIERIKNAQEKEIKLLEQQYGDERNDLINKAIEREIAKLDEKYKKEGGSEEKYLADIQAIRSKSDQNLLDSEKKLLEEKKKNLDADIQNIKNKYTQEKNIVLDSITRIQTDTKMLELQFNKEQEILGVLATKNTEDKKGEEIIRIRKKYLDQEIYLLKKQGQDQINEAENTKNKLLQDETLSVEQLQKVQTEYNSSILKINQDTQSKIQDAIDATTEKQNGALTSLQKQLKKISEYVDKVAEIWAQVGDIISQRNEDRFNNEEKRIDGLYNYEKQALEDQLAEGVIAREQYDNKIKELDQERVQQEKQLAMEKFQEQKKLQVVNATIQGTQAVLSAYSSGAATPIIGLATGPIYAAIAAAFAATQIAMIANQNFTAAGGGIVPGLGSSVVDSVPSLLAPGETVINAQSSSMYPELLNQVNMAGGGISLKPDMPAINKSDSGERVYTDNKKQQPIRAYVVETDVTSTQRRVERIKRSAEF